MVDQTDNLAEAWEALNGPDHIFITGPAGSGKSTLIRDYIAKNDGDIVVLAPTGIAAINVGGCTVHSFGHFPGRPISYSAIKWLDPNKELDVMKRELMLRAKAFIIDEISMLRADIMDQIAWFFEKNFPMKSIGPNGMPYGPFAGKKMIMVGDMDQLPPVIKEEAEKKMLAARYKTPFFFSAHCWIPERYASFRTITLTKIWRQSDPVFINLLNDIKNNRLAPFEIDRLNNSRYRVDAQLNPEDGIMLCGTNAVANEVNAYSMSHVEGETIQLVGEMRGNFDKSSCIVEPIINLKPGCRVMTMRNSNLSDNDYRNGSLGTFIGIDENGLLNILLDSGSNVLVAKYRFESMDYEYDKDQDRIKHKVTGEFLQYPVKVAYAITIHKAQGQTFDKVVIDLGQWGAFAHGQLYVALSRCRTLEGITLRRPLRNKDLIYDKDILEFNRVNFLNSIGSPRVEIR